MELIAGVPEDVVFRYVESLCRNSIKHAWEIVGMYIAERELNTQLEKCTETYGDLCNDRYIIEIKPVHALTDDFIVSRILDDEDMLNQLAKYIYLSKTLNKEIYYLFIRSINEYRLIKLETLLDLIFKKSEKTKEILDKLISKYYTRNITKRDIEIRRIVVELYKKGYSKYRISKKLGISMYKVKRILVEEGLEQVDENTCPRCFIIMTDFGKYYKCPKCGYIKIKQNNKINTSHNQI